MLKTTKYFFQAIFIYLLFILGKILGIKISRVIFSKLFSMIGPFVKSDKILEKNLSIFKKKAPSFEEKNIKLNMWKNYGMTFIEYVFLSHLQKSKSHMTIFGEENLSNVIKNNKPVIFISGHFANFELMSMEITKKKINLATIYRPLNNFFLNPLMEYLRKKYVCKNQIKKGLNGVREAIEFLNKDHCIALMVDQRVSEGERVNFFDVPAYTTTLPAQLAIKYKINIIPVFIERIGNNNFEINFHKEINSENFKNKTELTQELNFVLEKMIQRNPNQWIWTHNRWK